MPFMKIYAASPRRLKSRGTGVIIIVRHWIDKGSAAVPHAAGGSCGRYDMMGVRAARRDMGKEMGMNMIIDRGDSDGNIRQYF